MTKASNWLFYGGVKRAMDKINWRKTETLSLSLLNDYLQPDFYVRNKSQQMNDGESIFWMERSGDRK